MRGLRRDAAALPGRQQPVAARRSGLDRQLAFEHEIPVGDRTVGMPWDFIARVKRRAWTSLPTATVRPI